MLGKHQNQALERIVIIISYWVDILIIDKTSEIYIYNGCVSCLNSDERV